MKLPISTFTAMDWTKVVPTEHPGARGKALWRTVMLGDVRIRLVAYSPGYEADHWCARGHVLFVVSGELTTELRDGRNFVLSAGMSYHVSDDGDAPHRSRTAAGATLFIVD
jgi:quercetin dioxygenase-like cupin family protein